MARLRRGRWIADKCRLQVGMLKRMDLTGRDEPESRLTADDELDLREPPSALLRFARPAAGALLVALVGWLGYFYLVPTRAPAYVVERKPVAWALQGPGLLDATNRVVVTARISGRLNWIGKDRNDPVRKGEIVARLDDDDLKNQLDGAKAEAEAAERAVSASKSNRASAVARLEKLQQDVERRRRLVVTGAVSRVDLDATELRVKELAAELETATVAIARATAQAQAANAAASAAEARLNDATLRSPLDGLVVSRDRNVGDVVTPGAPIVQLVDPASIIISARFDESVMGVLSPGQAATVHFTSAPDRPFAGRVMRIGRLVDQETREFLVDLSLDSLPRNWALSQRTSVRIDVASQSESVLAPMRFIQRGEGKAGAWVLSGGRAHWRPVLVRHMIGPVVEIEKGLDFGDTLLDPAGRYSWEPISPEPAAP